MGKTKITTIDMTPTWEDMHLALLVLIECGDAKERAFSFVELRRMAKLADLYVAIQKQGANP